MISDSLDRELLNLIQFDFPITPEPFKKLAETLRINETEVLERLQKLMEKRVVRRIGGVFDSRGLGYSGSLCALQVPEESLEDVAKVVNSYPGVTHNYLRDSPYNMWFTLLTPNREQLNEIVQEIKDRTGVGELLNLPAVRVFKVNACFQLNEGSDDQ
ncbi:MAG TPA: AsnC family transcriptional regulator [Bacillota bacterium]|nr:AsnC family transcriptional regulator [Bacillota bacterium]